MNIQNKSYIFGPMFFQGIFLSFIFKNGPKDRIQQPTKISLKYNS